VRCPRVRNSHSTPPKELGTLLLITFALLPLLREHSACTEMHS
jgi:hypothetical protein